MPNLHMTILDIDLIKTINYYQWNIHEKILYKNLAEWVPTKILD